MTPVELDIWGEPVSRAVHDFKWAWKTLKAGGKVRRAKWAKGGYIYVNPHNILVFYVGEEHRVKEVAHPCDWQDLSATDWQAHAG